MPANLFSGADDAEAYSFTNCGGSCSRCPARTRRSWRYVPSERARFESLGWAILITSCMAMISMWFALSSALGINGVLAFPSPCSGAW